MKEALEKGFMLKKNRKKIRNKGETGDVKAKKFMMETHSEMHLQHTRPAPPPSLGKTDLCLKHQSEQARFIQS